MSESPVALRAPPIYAWRLTKAKYQSTWDSGEGARDYGGRWNSKGQLAVYSAFDASTALLETAVQTGFEHLDLVPHVLTKFEIADPSLVHVINAEDLPNATWRRPVLASVEQQLYGDALLAAHAFVAIPSVVCPESWNVLFQPGRAAGSYRIVKQTPLSLDPRLKGEALLPPLPPELNPSR